MKKVYITFIFITLLYTSLIFSQTMSVSKIEPPNWWVGMKWNKVQLMVYGKNISDAKVSCAQQPLKIEKVNRVENPDYLFIDVSIPNSLSDGNYTFSFENGNEKVKYDFPIYERITSEDRYQGFNNSDVIYLITPDRFVNGDTTNDEVAGMVPDFEPDYYLGRHGGDIQGIINKLDYLQDLGFTAIWNNPLVENNNDISYHGYAATDLYNVDARFGNNELYKKLVDEAHKRGMKIIYDHVSNHISDNHPWMKNLPTPDWINGTVANHMNAVHDKMALSDIHADSSTIIQLTKGWFVDSMPDLNQENPFLSNYLIQNTLWWIESTGLDGIREDTYPYVNQLFMSNWAEAILNEHPTLNIVGEVWTGQPAFLADYQTGSYMPRSFDTYLPSVTDFGIRDIYYEFLKGDKTIYSIYETLSKDYLYPDPDNLVTFIDNHDVTRAMLASDGNIDKVKIALTLLLTTRGIPQILYGTEIGLKGGEDHGLLRANFPGGFPNDSTDAFTEQGRTENQNDIFNFLRKLLHLRKEYPSLAKGKLIHFPPVDDVYHYIKSYDDEIVLIIINGSKENKTFTLNSNEKYFSSIKNFYDLYTGEAISFGENEKTIMERYEIKILGF